MKTLVILAIILTILAVYFVLNTEKSFSVKGLYDDNASKVGNALPAGTDAVKLILNKIKNINPKITDSKVIESGIVDKIKSTIGDVKDKILKGSVSLIKEPIKNK